MKDNRETKKKLLASAKREFMEKGYMQASLRCICKNADVTTGALYFFFKDKEDLFASLVEAPLDELSEVMDRHFAEEIGDAGSGWTWKGDFSRDVDAAKQIIHCLYRCRDEFLMILTKSQGSRFETCAEQFVSVSETHYRRLAEMFAERIETAPDNYMIHWTAHMTVDIFVHMLSHEPSEEAAIAHIEPIVKYLVSGWFGMMS